MTSNDSNREPADLVTGGGLSPSPVAVTRVRLAIAYDGTDFSGWAIQPERRTVCGELIVGMQTVLRTPVSLTVAGRTDAGVHATAQVAHVDLPEDTWDRFSGSLVRRLAGVLPKDVRVLSAEAVPPEFDARFSALSRSYIYRISDQPWGVDPLRRHEVIVWPRPLDTARMQAASDLMLGLHNFAAYCKSRPGATTIRTLQQVVWGREPDGIVAGAVTADAFCHSMVRSLVGALLAVGDGSLEVDVPAQLLRQSSRSNRVTVAPARGLTLTAVEYPSDDQLSTRNTVTRRRRDLENDDSWTAEGDPRAADP